METVTDSGGDTRSTYGYTAYGADDTAQFTGADKPGAGTPEGEPASAYRFNGMRIDPGSGDYDMGFRDYAPGLNRFLTRDSYDGALSDLQMAADPYTGNRYAFASGNPISWIELDGHCWGPDLVCDVTGGIVDVVTAPVTGLVSSYIGAGAAIACPSTVGYAYTGACGGAQETVTASVQQQYRDLLDLGGAHGSAGWRAGQVIGAVGIPGATATRAAAAAAAARAAARRAAEATARRTATQTADKIVVESGTAAVRTLTASERATLADALRTDKLDHVFDPKHNFDSLVQQFGSREVVMGQFVRSLGGPLPTSGPFEVSRLIGGQPVVIRGAVVNGIPRIGTAFSP